MVPTLQEGRGKRELICNRYTVTTRMISALRWADVSRFIDCAGQSHATVSINHNIIMKRKVSRSGGVEPASVRLSAERLNHQAKPAHRAATAGMAGRAKSGPVCHTYSDTVHEVSCAPGL